MQQDIIPFLKKHNYVVSISKQGKYICLNLPGQKNKHENIDAKTIKYRIQYGKNPQIIKHDKVREVIKAPNYAIRLYILCDIIEHCRQIKYGYNCVIFDKNGRELYGLDDSFLLTMKEPTETDKEDILFNLFEVISVNGFNSDSDEIADKHQIREGYDLLRTIFEKGLE